MPNTATASAALPDREIRAFAKKYRISNEDAAAILQQYAGDMKGADKAARRIAL